VATKQPAMTASALAKEIDNRKDNTSSLNAVALTIAKVSRSQLIAVFGNLMAVFPVSLIIAFTVNFIFDHPVLEEEHSLKYLNDIHPMYSLSWWYAAIAGFYLFLAGIVAGYFDNAVIYGKIPERIRQHPTLSRLFSTSTINKLADYLDHNFGAIMSNIMIGIFLGTASLIGKTFGIPFDIRHITFSLGNFAMSLQSMDFQISYQTLLWIFLGIFSIGFFNIAISFGMAFYIAMKSRNISLAQLLELPKLLFLYFKKHPLDFIYPPKTERTEEEVFTKPL
jgi:site-specific recombinase